GAQHQIVEETALFKPAVLPDAVDLTRGIDCGRREGDRGTNALRNVDGRLRDDHSSALALATVRGDERQLGIHLIKGSYLAEDGHNHSPTGLHDGCPPMPRA